MNIELCDECKTKPYDIAYLCEECITKIHESIDRELVKHPEWIEIFKKMTGGN